MNQDEKLKTLREWQTRIETADVLIAPVADALRLPPENPIHEAVWGMQQGYTEAVGKLVGDSFGWMSWYAHENDFGRKGMEAGPMGELRPIATLDDLLWVMGVSA